jgi:hypothetical protein
MAGSLFDRAVLVDVRAVSPAGRPCITWSLIMTKSLFVSAGIGVCMAIAGTASARPNVDGANVHTRVFNDAPTSTVTSTNNYPDLVSIEDAGVSGGNFANRHNFRLADGMNDAIFANGDGFTFAADVTITGTAAAEGGLNLSPWWSQQVDGNFMLNAGSGEIACFGGRLPFYSFTAHEGVHYTRGETARLGITYDPRGTSEAAPGAIRYFLSLGGADYASPWLLFDQGNPAEDPPHGLWGILNDAELGGYFQVLVNNNDPLNHAEIRWENISYVPAPGAAALLAVGGMVATRRRRR